MGLIGAIISLVLRLLGVQKPQAVQEGENYGRAQADLDQVLRSDQIAQKATDARDAVAAGDSRPDGLRLAVNSDPDCRDCGT